MDIRTKPYNRRERVAIIPNGMSRPVIIGEVNIVGCVPIRNKREFTKLFTRHRVTLSELYKYCPAGFEKTVWGWEFEGAQAYLPGDRIPVNKPGGAIGSVILGKEGVLQHQ